MIPTSPRERITFYLPKATKDQVERDAAERGQTISVWMERACKERLTERPSNAGEDAG